MSSSPSPGGVNLPTAPQFEPNPQDLQQALALLEALRDPRRSDHVLALQSLTHNITSNVFILHMMFIFVHGQVAASGGVNTATQPLDINLRQLAGFIIKNYVFANLLQLTQEVQAYIKYELVKVLHDPCLDLRNTGAILLSKFTQCFPIEAWIDLLPPIIHYLDPQYLQVQPYSLDGCLQAMKRICEDSAMKLAMDHTIRPIEALLPKLLQLFHSPEATVRLRALESYNCLLYLLENSDSMPVANDYRSGSPNVSQSVAANVNHPLIMHMNTFISSLSALASDPEPKVRKVICSSLTTITCLHIALLEPFFKGICDFMSMTTLMDSNEDVAIESCEFWIAMLQHINNQGGIHHQSPHRQLLTTYLPIVIPNLITRLRLTQEQMENDRREEEEENSGQRKINIKPIHHRNNQSDTSGGPDDNANTTGNNGSAEGELSSKWTLRKQAALTLDSFALSFPPKDILANALPKIQECFQSNDSILQESGVLALGTLSNGCLDDMMIYLPQLYPFLMNNLIQNNLPEMRSITCWVLSRYCRLFADIYNNGMSYQQQHGSGDNVSPTHRDLHQHIIPPEQGIELYLKTLELLVGRMFDPHIKVIIATCSALCILIDNSFVIYNGSDDSECNILTNHVHTIFQVIGQAFDHYGAKAMLLLVDMIGTLSDTLGRDIISKTEISQLYLPKLMNNFITIISQSLDNNHDEEIDCRILPFLECFTSLLSQIGLEAKDYLPMILQRCVQLLGKTLLPLQRQQQSNGGTIVTSSTHDDNNDHDEEDEALMHLDYAICGFDVIAAMSEGLDINSFVSLISHQIGNLIQFLFIAMECNYCPELRQSAFSLAGELCKLSTDAKQSQLYLADDPLFPSNIAAMGDAKNALFTSELVTRLFHYATVNLQEDYPFVCNNAAWMIGELVVRFGNCSKLLAPFVIGNSTTGTGGMLERLVYALHSHEIQDNLKINLAVTIGRLGTVCTIEVASMAEDFFCDWCSVLAYPCPVTEKRQAFTGLLAVLHASQDLVLGNKATMYSLLVACVSWSDMAEGDLTPELAKGFGQVFAVLQAYDGPLWTRVINTFSHNGHSIQALISLFA